MYSTSLILSFLILGVADGQTDVSRCPDNLIRDNRLQAHGEKCYQFVIHHHQDWPHANNDCRNKGGNLVAIRNSGEQNFIMSSLSSLNFRGNGIWIGLHDQGHQRAFSWVTGEPVDYVYWANGQPNNGGVGLPFVGGVKEDCVLLKYGDSGHWHDYPCEALLFLPENYGWICEFKMLEVQQFRIPSETFTAKIPIRSTASSTLTSIIQPKPVNHIQVTTQTTTTASITTTLITPNPTTLTASTTVPTSTQSTSTSLIASTRTPTTDTSSTTTNIRDTTPIAQL